MNANIQIIGHVGRNPELFTFESGKTKATFSVCVNEYKRNDKETKSTWFTVEAFNGTSELVMELVSKGREVVINGTLRLNEYYSKANQRYVTQPVITLDKIHLCGPKPEQDKEGQQSEQAA